jgi:small subunit ribosomal protein S1
MIESPGISIQVNNMSEKDDFASLFGEFEAQQSATKKRTPKVGDKVTGTVVSIQKETLFIDLGEKTEGEVGRDDFTDSDGNLSVAVGDTIETFVSGSNADTGMLQLGSQHTKRLHGSDGLRQAYEEQLPVEGHVTGTTKGGLEVEFAGVRGFCPASHIDINFVEDLERFVGERLAFRITKFEGGRKVNLVVSRRALLEEAQQALATETRERLEVGAVMTGKVTTIKEFGAFVDLGGIEGMIHISELAFGRVEHPKDLLSVGQQVEVSVLKIETTDNARQPERIALSIRALEKDPWRDVLTDYTAGTQVEGIVSRLQPFGAFIELAPGVDGLAHISELGAGRRITHPQEVLSVGDTVQATVLSVDADKRRISLTLDSKRQTSETTKPEVNVADYAKQKKSFGTLGDVLRESMKKEK